MSGCQVGLLKSYVEQPVEEISGRIEKRSDRVPAAENSLEFNIA